MLDGTEAAVSQRWPSHRDVRSNIQSPCPKPQTVKVQGPEPQAVTGITPYSGLLFRGFII